jgi:hypothetical protein
MTQRKEPPEASTRKLTSLSFAKLIIYALTVYLVGFFALGLGYRSENDNVRTTAAIIDGNVYWPLINIIKDTVPGVRSAVVMRFRVFCVGAEKRCRVIEE